MNEKNSGAHARSKRFLLAAAAFVFFVSVLVPFAAAQGQDEQMQYFQFAYSFYYGSSSAECYSNCYAPCLQSCKNVAASIGGTGGDNCGSVCPSSCSSRCASYFSSSLQADDGLPVPQTPDGWIPYEPAGAPQEYWPRVPPNLPYSPPGTPSNGQQGSYTAEPVEPQQQENYLTPCYPGQNYCVSPGTVSETDPGEPVYPTFPPCTPENYCYSIPGSSVGVATPQPEPECPTAPDGHPMRWYDYLGCQDVYWKEHYCAVGASCNDCTYRQGCIWNGAACVPCNAPSCSYSCIRPGGAQGAGHAEEGVGDAGAQNQEQATQPITVRQKDIPGPAPQLPEDVPTPAPGQPTVRPTGQPTTQPTLIPTPPMQCASFAFCKSCVKAPKAADGNAQCGWSESVGACLDEDAWNALNASGLKAGWFTEETDCGKNDASEARHCFEYKDCFSCAGGAGVKRRCQWSVKNGACQPYNPLAEFKTNAAPNAEAIILPALCPNRDCSQYADCADCQENAACLWDFNGSKCASFKGQNQGEKLGLFPGSCGKTATASATPTPSPVQCPKDCECDAAARVTKCGGAAVKDAGFVHADRAAANAGAAVGMDYVDGIEFNAGATQSGTTFVVRGHKSRALFFLIPVNVDYAATVNAQTGEVEKIDAAWWAFLAG